MAQKILDVLMLGRCSHEFSWPRRGADGDYYQVCLLCAAEYKYDWTTMRRTQRVEHAKPETVIRRSHTREKRPSWTPRARRLKLDVALRYRVNSTSTWHEGKIENLSQTGVLFEGPVLAIPFWFALGFAMARSVDASGLVSPAPL